MKYTILTAGCDKNVVLSQKVMAKLNRENERVDDLNDADVIYINTCSFIDAARNESLELIRNVYGKGKKIVVLGCLPQNAKDVLIREFPEVMVASCGSYRENSLPLIKSIYKACGWDRKYSYRVDKILSPDKQAVVFCLPDGVQRKAKVSGEID